jgi:ATP-dependent Clp protease adaptor protein ClpS
MNKIFNNDQKNNTIQQPYFYDEEGQGVELLEYEDEYELLKPPAHYAVSLINDDYTPMDFVVLILKKYFNKQHEDAIEIMLAIHENGQAVCGVYIQDIALTKVKQVLIFAKSNQHPLQCIAKPIQD